MPGIVVWKFLLFPGLAQELVLLASSRMFNANGRYSACSLPRRMVHVFSSWVHPMFHTDSRGSRHSVQFCTVLQARCTNDKYAETRPVAGELGVGTIQVVVVRGKSF